MLNKMKSALMLMLIASSAMAGTFAVDTTKASGPLTGLWWNPQESGWGVTITQQYNVLYSTFFTYDKAGLPIWYAASCTIDNATGSCFGNAYTFVGGAANICRTRDLTFHVTPPKPCSNMFSVSFDVG